MTPPSAPPRRGLAAARRLRRAARVLALLAGTTVGLAGCGFSQEDVYCQRAGVHVEGCCPEGAQFLSDLSCAQIPSDVSRCLLELDCERIRSGGLCAGPTAFTQGAARLCPATAR